MTRRIRAALSILLLVIALIAPEQWMGVALAFIAGLLAQMPAIAHWKWVQQLHCIGVEHDPY
jgi:hypothetical protein